MFATCTYVTKRTKFAPTIFLRDTFGKCKKQTTTLESRIIVHARNMYFDEISTMHGLIRDMHEPKFSTFELFWGIFAMFCPFCHVFL